ncbi:MAG: molybdopterin-dependent oxidoreductase [Actinobacteria bacterium]|nr:molybdopterin-dependent oxidoreductase [Actinomycetota bacterium]
MLLRPPGRQTNQALLVVLLFVFGTGIATVAIGSPGGRWAAIGHGIFGVAVVLLIPWKSMVVRGGLRHPRPSRWLSLLLAVLALLTLAAGLGYATGLVRSIAGKPGLWVHIAIALTLVPLLVWHLCARGIRSQVIRLRRSDVSRRAVLRAGLVAAGAGAVYAATESATAGLGLPGASRRFTGSYETASFRPDVMPSTSWLLDAVPRVDPGRWRLTIQDGQGRRELTLADLTAYDIKLRATLDCTSGWYSHQDWTGVPLATLIRRSGDAQSVYVHSVTGYWVRFPIHDMDRLLLATQAGGAPLSADHGFPVRVVAPGRRGYWWVKWVDSIALQTTPAWWQPPFPTG